MKSENEELSAVMEDYLGVVLRLQREKRFARVSDVASTLNVAKSAATTALQNLAGRGLLNYKAYEPVTLTDEGESIAQDILLRHTIMTDFLKTVLELDAGRAETMAYRMEHAFDTETFQKFVCFLAFIGTRPSGARSLLDEFRGFARREMKGRTCRECMQKYVQQIREEIK